MSVAPSHWPTRPPTVSPKLTLTLLVVMSMNEAQRVMVVELVQRPTMPPTIWRAFVELCSVPDVEQLLMMELSALAASTDCRKAPAPRTSTEASSMTRLRISPF